MATSLNASLNVSLNPQSLNASTKQISQALGRITGQASEFQKSLDASTARVFAFGATTVVINGVTQSFKKLVSTTIDVQKRLLEINSIFQASEQTFNRFRNSIFKVAQETGQSFSTVADGAAELARQGLSAEETASRLKSALILTRISGMDAEKSVKALTAAINGFTSAGLTHTQIVNKMVAVDTAFAVSTDDLAEAFKRAGSTAEDAGVSFNELLGLITAVEQKTARGGAVIGNAFKSIFTRLQRGTTISELKELGVAIDANQTGVQKLQALSTAIEGIADPTVVSKIKELAGGVFQINVVSAALKDLGSNTSIFQKAAITAASATNEAFEKNRLLNESISAQINSLVQGLTSLAERVGAVTFGPLLEGLVGIATKVTDFLNNALDPEKGNVFVKGLFKTIGSFLSGPAVVIFTAAFVKIFKLVAKFAGEGLRTLFSMGTQTERLKQIEGGIVGLLQRDQQLRNAITSQTATQVQKEQAVIMAIQRENALLAQQAQLMRQLASAAAARGVSGINAAGTFTGRRGRPFAVGGKVTGGSGTKDDVPAMLTAGEFVMRKSAVDKFGEPFMSSLNQGRLGFNKGGFVPNYNRRGSIAIGGFAGPLLTPPQASQRITSGVITPEQAAMSGHVMGKKKRADGANFPRYIADSPDSKKALMLVPQAQAFTQGALNTNFQSKKRLETRFSGFDGSVAGIDPNLKRDSGFRRMLRMDTILDASLTRGVNNAMDSVVSKSGNKLKMQPRKFTTKQVKARVLKEGGAGAFGALRGAIFESIIDAVTGGVKAGAGNNTLDVRIAGASGKVVEEIFGIEGLGYKYGDFKNSQGQKSKFISQTMRSLPRKGAPVGMSSGGLVPNYAGGAGVPTSMMRVHKDSKGSPIAVTNLRDEPNGLQDAIKRERQGIGMFAGGFVPNYAKGSGGGLGGATGFILALGSVQMALQTMVAATDQSADSSIALAEAQTDAALSSEKGFRQRMAEVSAIDKASRSASTASSGLEGVASAANTAITGLMALSTLNMVTGGFGGRALGKVGTGIKGGLSRAGGAIAGTKGMTSLRSGIQRRLPMGKDPLGGQTRFQIRDSLRKDGFGKMRSIKASNNAQRAANARTRAMGRVGGIGKFAGAPLAVGMAGFSAFNSFQDEKAGLITKQERDRELGGAGGALAGGLGGAKVGAMLGAFGGPVGMAIGGLIGGGVGALAGSGIGKGLVSAFQGPEPLSPELTERFAQVSASNSRNRELGFGSSDAFMDRAEQNINKMRAAGQDTSIIEKEYVESLKALKDQYSKEEHNLEEIEAAQIRLAQASRDLAGIRFDTVQQQDEHDRKVRIATDKLARANEKLAAARAAATNLEAEVSKRLGGGKSIKGMAESASMQAGLKIAPTRANKFAGAAMLASEQNAMMTNINQLRQEQLTANLALQAEQQKPESMQDTKQLAKDAAEAGKRFKDAAIQAGTSFLNKMQDIEHMREQNEIKISAARDKAAQAMAKLSDHLVKEGGVDTKVMREDALTLFDLVKKGDKRTKEDQANMEAGLMQFDNVGLGDTDTIIAGAVAASAGLKKESEEFAAALAEAKRQIQNARLDSITKQIAGNVQGGDDEEFARFLTSEGIETFGAELDESTKLLIEQQNNLRAEMGATQTAFNTLHNNEATKEFAKDLKKLQGELKASVGSFDKVKKFAESNLEAAGSAAELVEKTKVFIDGKITDLQKLEATVSVLQGKVDNLTQ